MQCDTCNSNVPEAAKFCPECGSALRPNVLGPPVSAGNPSPEDREGLKRSHYSEVILIVVATFALLTFAFLLMRSVGQDDSSGRPSPSARDQPLEQQLAIIDGVASDAVKVNRFRSLLAQLSSRYPENQQQISDRTAKASQYLRTKGISVSLLDLLEGMHQTYPGRDTDLTYTETLAIYTLLRDKAGESHKDTVDGMLEIFHNPATLSLIRQQINSNR